MSIKTDLASQAPSNDTAIRSWGRLFAFLFSGSGVWAIMAWAAAALLYKSLWGNWDKLDFMIITGFFVFRGLIEWGIHSWLYHANPLPVIGKRLKSVISEMHFKHHTDPLDLSTLLITWKGITAVMTTTLLGSSLLFWSINRGMTMMMGFTIAAFIIEFLHLICHCRIQHKSAFIKNLVTLHRSHHYKYQNKNYGVSSSLGDHLFRTYKKSTASSFSSEELGKDIVNRRNKIRADAKNCFDSIKRHQ